MRGTAREQRRETRTRFRRLHSRTPAYLFWRNFSIHRHHPPVVALDACHQRKIKREALSSERAGGRAGRREPHEDERRREHAKPGTDTSSPLQHNAGPSPAQVPARAPTAAAWGPDTRRGASPRSTTESRRRRWTERLGRPSQRCSATSRHSRRARPPGSVEERGEAPTASTRELRRGANKALPNQYDRS